MRSHSTESHSSPPEATTAGCLKVHPSNKLEGLTLEGLDTCIHCGMCLPACPTYQATGSEAESPRGRLYLMKKLLQDELLKEEVTPHLDQCLACHACETACPSGVQYGRLLMETRSVLAPTNHSWKRALKRFVFRRILTSSPCLVFGGAALRFYQRSGVQTLIRKSGVLKLIPPLATQENLLPTVPQRRALNAGDVFGEPDGEPVTLLIGCVMDVFYNPVHWDTITVLVANGYRVHIPTRTCCGALAHHAGELDITRQLAQKTMTALNATSPNWIVINSAGCGSSIKEYPHLLPDSPDASSFANKVVDIMELLAKKPLAPFKNSVSATVAYHAACHLYHVQQVKTQPIDLLSQVPGITLAPLENADTCCGSAGIYNLEHPELSEEILNTKMDCVRTACAVGGIDTLTTGNPGCMLQLAHGIKTAGLNLQVRHPISILAEAYRE